MLMSAIPVPTVVAAAVDVIAVMKIALTTAPFLGKPGREASRRVFCLLKGIAEGTYNTKHAEAAKHYA